MVRVSLNVASNEIISLENAVDQWNDYVMASHTGVNHFVNKVEGAISRPT